ncbi:putative cysteine protease RD21B [Silene latifolia]|uniref:putative cysteine protease RD21B n=1 Tax=Silene latifolia TaxID=37657 RepID=UPI003D77A8F4
MSYIIDTTGATRVTEFSWPDSAFSDRALCDVESQGLSCVCYGLTVAEASRGVINLKQDCDVPKLSSMELITNCFGETCKGHYASSGLEWVTRESIAEASAMKLDLKKIRELVEKPEKAPPPEKAKGIRHAIDEWEAISNCEEDMKSYILRQPVIISLCCSITVIDNCQGGLVDPFVMQNMGGKYSHSMLVTGFGFFVFEDKSIKNFWLVKNSQGLEVGVNGYFYILRNSSQPIKKWVVFNPMVPLSFAKEESYEKPHLVKEMSFKELEAIEMNLNLDIIILFYTGARDHRSFFRDFERASRIYFTDKDDVIFALVNATGFESKCDKYGFDSDTFPKLRVYKFIARRGIRLAIRRLAEDGEKLETLDIDFEKMSSFLIPAAGGVVRK